MYVLSIIQILVLFLVSAAFTLFVLSVLAVYFNRPTNDNDWHRQRHKHLLRCLDEAILDYERTKGHGVINRSVFTLREFLLRESIRADNHDTHILEQEDKE